jgi:hypothetical protein
VVYIPRTEAARRHVVQAPWRRERARPVIPLTVVAVLVVVFCLELFWILH